MAWITLTIKVDAAHTEALSDGLLELGALSVDIHDAAAGTAGEQLLFGEPGEPAEEIWCDAEVTALFDESIDVAAIMQAVTEVAQLPDQPVYHLGHVEEQDWVRLTQSQFSPIQISSRLWIVPTWHESPDPAAINLILDPGLAFGTGSHPTTHLCLSWLDAHLQEGDSLLDYGCGSGILAIAAVKLGASDVIGIDIDPRAIEASRDNAVRNQCDQSRIAFAPAHDEINMGSRVGIPVDIVVANILANPLILLAPLLMRAVRQGGHIVLSGVLREQAEDVKLIYQQWFQMSIADEKEGWVLLAGIKK
ncbi:[LSU ribosomal protein L11P]-lysine N-methyltransferase [Nitrosomonas cryotolerans]|uniref:Ribosomal protein L11 methyltransferase n=1 Tax=Nitrosomonas cryotolerans ATCC 49181 TaxID=1131553 RepID=A0A1N6IB54_9PROT|nr:50S ribosomal protein L11 methyltransferase [Nitrosomonas cryotolerans]SFP61577.1 [LSU ribosomal protein L11P]-lysine N-methyltransferase [Nitrosomonas cryotolerans]SIO29268.1 [LSU ribosomal protein L11P]-lysine N-methyltransferase [Nitrosomonas cryotolerans ATCC 49181]